MSKCIAVPHVPDVRTTKEAENKICTKLGKKQGQMKMSAPPLEWAGWSAQSSRTNSAKISRLAMSNSVLLTLIQICLTSIICFTTVNIEWTDRPRVLPRLLPDFVCFEVSLGNFSMKSYFQPTLINMLFDSFEISSKLYLHLLSLEKSTLLSLRCSETSE